MIYLDNAATTKPLPEVVDEMSRVLNQVYGNASSIYSLGRDAKMILEKTRRDIANFLGATNKQIIFTSGGTESNTTAIYSLLQRTSKKHIITTVIEHPSVMNVMQQLERRGYNVTYLPVGRLGYVTVSNVKKAITDDTALICIMATNNETGVHQPIYEIAQLANENGILFHSDAVQAFGSRHLNMKELLVDTLSVSAHKIHGPKGVGCLYVREPQAMSPLLLGGGQEGDKRSGTENIPGIAGFGVAVNALDIDETKEYFKQLAQHLQVSLQANNIDYMINGELSDETTSYKVVNLHFPSMDANQLLIQLDLAGVMVSAGSACSAGTLKPSRILTEMYPEEPNRSGESIRVSFSKMTTTSDIDTFVDRLVQLNV